MCFKQQSTPEPASPPAPPLEGAEAPEVGASRKDETVSRFGSNQVSYRVDRDGRPTVGASGNQIRM